MFIEVKRITTTGRGTSNEKPLIQLELIKISDIKACRHWHIGKNDAPVAYEQTLLIMEGGKQGEDKPAVDENNYMDRDNFSQNKKVPTILIQEKYEAFRDRLSTRVPVNKCD